MQLVLSGLPSTMSMPKATALHGPHLHGVLAAEEQCLCAELIHVCGPANSSTSQFSATIAQAHSRRSMSVRGMMDTPIHKQEAQRREHMPAPHRHSTQGGKHVRCKQSTVLPPHPGAGW
jgi:hypothetical protein